MYKIVGFAKIPQTFCSIFIKTSHKKFGEARKCSYLYGVEIKASEKARDIPRWNIIEYKRNNKIKVMEDLLKFTTDRKTEILKVLTNAEFESLIGMIETGAIESKYEILDAISFPITTFELK